MNGLEPVALLEAVASSLLDRARHAVDLVAHPILSRLLVISSGMGVGLSGFCGFFGLPIRRPTERDTLNKPGKPVLVSTNKTYQVDQTHKIHQFRLSLRPRPPN